MGTEMQFTRFGRAPYPSASEFTFEEGELMVIHQLPVNPAALDRGVESAGSPSQLCDPAGHRPVRQRVLRVGDGELEGGSRDDQPRGASPDSR
jgi:hypothetical protein